ncbi:DUF4835 family protein [bacterium]|nr:DUF4835 family protein [bacterium]MBU1985234.1 DUF4835 family protein [bacterium]
MRLSRHIWPSILTVCAFLVFATPASAQLLYPEVTIDLQRLPEEAQTKLANLDTLLTTYLMNLDWAGDVYQYDYPVQISIFFTDYNPDPQEDRYKAKMIATNKQDVRLEDTRWEFGLRAPIQEIRFQPNTFHPFSSVVEFYIWILIGMEYDRLEKLGGQTYYEKARNIYLESSGTIYYFGWDFRNETLRNILDDANQAKRELDFFYFTGIYFDQQKDYKNAKDYLYYALVKLDKVPLDIMRRFLEVNHRQFAEALVRAGYPKGIQALMQMDPQHHSVYESIAPKGGNK